MAVYPVIGVLPSSSGACQLTAMTVCPGMVLTVIGAPGGDNGVTVLDADFHPLPGLLLEPTVKERHHLQFRLHRVDSGDHLPRLPLNLKVCGPEFEITLLSPPGLSAMVRHLLQASPLIVGG